MNFWTWLDRNGEGVGFIICFLGLLAFMAYLFALSPNGK
jgi:hypothetical protein